MKLPEIEQEALALNEQERAALVLTLMDTLPVPALEVSDEEAMRRDEELESGIVTPLTHEEFSRTVRETRQ